MSRLRRRNVFTPPQQRLAVSIGNPRWLVPAMLFFFLAGLVWIVVYYLTNTVYPVNFQDWLGWQGKDWLNLIIGFGLIMVGFGLATRWR